MVIWIGSLFDLLFEIHIIAYTYHWSEEEVKKLTTKRRKTWCKIIQWQKDAEAYAIKKK